MSGRTSKSTAGAVFMTGTRMHIVAEVTVAEGGTVLINLIVNTVQQVAVVADAIVQRPT